MAAREVVSPSAGSEHSLHTMVSPAPVEPVHQQEPSGDSTIVDPTPPMKDADSEDVQTAEDYAGAPSDGDGKAQESDGAEGWDVVSARDGASPPKAKGADVTKDGKGGEKKAVTGGKVAEAIKKFATKATTPGTAAKPTPGKLAARTSLSRPTAATLNRSTTTKTSTTPAATSTASSRPGHKPSPSISSVKNGTPLSSSTVTAPKVRSSVGPTAKASTTTSATLARRQSVASSVTARAPASSTNGKAIATGTATGKRTPTSSNASSVKPVTALRTTTPPSGAAPRMTTKAASTSAPHRPVTTPSVAPAASKPAVPKVRSSIAPTTGKLPAATTTSSSTGLHGPVKLSTAGESRIRELEEQLEQHKLELANRETAFQEERTQLEEHHAAEIAALRGEVDASSAHATVASDKRIEELQKAHAAELDQLKEASGVQLQELKQLLEQTQASLEEALDQCKALTAEGQDKDSKVVELQAAIVAAEAGLEGAQEEAARLKEVHSAGAEQLATARTEVESLQAELQVQIKEVEHSKRIAEKSGASSSELQDKLLALEKQVAELESIKTAAESAWDQERQSLSMELETHVTATAKGKEQLAALEETAQAQQSEIERLHIAQTALAGDHDQARQLVDQHAAKIAELNAQLRETAAEHDKLLMEAAQLSDSKVLDLENRLADALKERDEVMEQLRQAKKRAEEAELELQGAREAIAVGDHKADALVEAVGVLQNNLEAQQAEHEEKYATVFEDAKAAAQEAHAAELAAIRSDLAITHSQLQAAHAAELEATAAEHATALAAANAEHAAQLQAAQDQQAASSSALNDVQVKLEKATTFAEDLTRKVENLEQLVNTLRVEAAKVNPSAETDLQHALRELDSMRDELEGTKSVLEMNKSHFQQTLEEMQSQNRKDAAAAAETRAQEAAEIQGVHERAMADLQAEMRQLRAELQDERMAKNTALAQAQQARMKTPPPAVVSTPPVSPSHLTKLHEAHNAKVAELEGTIKRLAAELDKRPSATANTAVAGEPTVPAPAPRAATPPAVNEAKDVSLVDLPPLPPTPAHVHGKGDDEDDDETY